MEDIKNIAIRLDGKRHLLHYDKNTGELDWNEFNPEETEDARKLIEGFIDNYRKDKQKELKRKELAKFFPAEFS